MDYTYNQFTHGQKVVCKIGDTEVSDAVISINPEGYIYICQDRVQGSETPELFGYRYSWQLLSPGDDFEEGFEDVTCLTLLDIIVEETTGRKKTIKHIKKYRLIDYI